MAENRWNNDDFEGEPFEFDGHPYLFEPEYTDEELRERDERAARERQRAADATTDLAPARTSGKWWCTCHCCEVRSANRRRVSMLPGMGPFGE